MRSNRFVSAGIALDYVTARLSGDPEGAEEVREDAAQHVYELIDGLTYLLVGLAREVAATEGLTIEHVLREQALRFAEGDVVSLSHVHDDTAASVPEEVPLPEQAAPGSAISGQEPVLAPVPVRRLEVQHRAAHFEEADEDENATRPDEWKA